MRLNERKNRNLGIELLRMLLIFWVLSFHCLRTNNKILLLITKEKRFHVPCFFFISHYYLFSIINSKDISKMYLRLERLLIPYSCYPIITWTINNLFFVFFRKNRFHRELSLNDLKIQLIFGRKFMIVQWFNFNLIILTIFFFILSIILKSRFISIIKLMGFFSYFLLYSKDLLIFFCNYKESVLGSVGYLLESFPLGVSALYLSSIGVLKKLENNKAESMLYSFLILFFVFKYPIFLSIMGNNNKGIIQIFVSFSFFILFYLIPFKEQNDCFKLFIKIITNFTQGIYCLHLIVFSYAVRMGFKANSLFHCSIIYFISYLISFLGMKIFGKTKLKYFY